MKHLLTLTVGICLLISMPAIADRAAEEAAIRKVEEKFNAAVLSHDIEATLATVDDIAESWDGTIKGKAAVRKAFESAFAGPWKNLQSTMVDEIGIVFVTPEVAIYKCIYEWGGTVDEAGDTVPTGKYLYARVYVKRNGKWLGCGYLARPMDE